MSDRRAAIDLGLRQLHGSNRAAELCALHEEAAGLMDSPEESRFHLTHAWVYALVAGKRAAINRLETLLRELGGLG